MKYIVITLFLLLTQAQASDKLIFGAISPVESEIMKKRLNPLISYLEKVTGKNIEFQTGYNYDDTINKFANKTFDIGFIGPVPYIKTKNINPDSINILAGLKNEKDKPFQTVIISKKGSNIVRLSDIKGHTFAFGSPDSTLSYYVPMNILIEKDLNKKIKKYVFLGLHDKVAQYVIMGKYDVGAVKRSVADKYSKYLQVVKKSKPLPDFSLVASSKLDKKIFNKIQAALLNLKDEKILKSLKKSAVGLERRVDSDYNIIRDMMNNVDNLKQSRL